MATKCAGHAENLWPTVGNITNGLPIFLYNYTNRTLHGVYEAVGPGYMDLTTPFPSQVGQTTALHAYKWRLIMNII